jgi:hypothetical protein
MDGLVKTQWPLAIRHTQFLIYVIAINTRTAATSETRGLIHD